MKKLKLEKYNSGEIGFGAEILIFLLIVFVIWVLVGGAKKEQPSSPLLVPRTNQLAPINGYGSNTN